MKTNIVILLILFAGAFFMSPLISTPMLAEPTLQETACEPGFSRWPKCKCDRCRKDQYCIELECWDGPCEKE